MNRLDITVLESVKKWLEEEHLVVLVTVAATWGSSPRPAGSLLAWCDNGQFVGSVSGGCIEDDLLGEFSTTPPSKTRLDDYGVTAEKAASRGLPCGGRLRILIEPLDHEFDVDRILTAIASRGRIRRDINVETGKAALALAGHDDRTVFENEILTVVFEAQWRLLIIGAGELSQFVYQFASALGFSVGVCDPRENYRLSWPHRETLVSADMPDDFVAAEGCDQQTAVVALTHDPKIDDMAIMEALASPAFYVGALGSKRTNTARRERLAEHFNLSEERLAFMSGPIGIDLNTKTAAEIGLAVVVEIVARKNGVVVNTQREEALANRKVH